LVENDTTIALSGREVPLLKQVRSSGRARWLWLAGSVASALAAMGGLGFAMLANWLFEPSTGAMVAMLGFGALPLLFTLFSFSRSRRAAKSAKTAIHEARLSAVRDALATGRELSASDVTQMLALPPAASDELLAELNVDDSIMSTVTDAGDVTYRTASLKLRIEEAARAAGVDRLPDEDAEALEQGPKATAKAGEAPSSEGRS
jgi:hypothetical protein